MSRIQIEHLYRVDLDESIAEYALSEPLMHQDARADVFTAVLRRGMTPADLTGMQAMAYIIFAATKQTLALDGTISGSSVSVTLDEDCYAIPGGFRMALQLIQGDTRRTVLTVTGEICRTATDCVITGTEVVPTLPELLARIDDVTQAASAANSAAEEAILAACDARQAASDILLSSAPPIVCSTTGAVITVQDACEGRAFPALSLMGQTWQDSTPTPSAPAELVSIASPTVSVMGKNLFDKDSVQFVVGSFINASGAVESNASYAYSETYIPVAPGASYVFSGQIVEGAYNTVAFYDRKKAFISRFSPGAPDKNSTFTTPENCYFTRFNASPSLDVNTIQLETGSVATAYESCLPQRIQAAYTLHGIPVASGGNYTDENGQQWVCDEVDLARGKLIRHVAQVDNSGFKWVRSTDTHAQFNINPFVSDYLRTKDLTTTMASHVPVFPNVQVGGANEPARGTHFSLYSGTGNNIAYLILPLETASTQAEFDAWLAAQEAAGTPVEFLYALAQPVETDLSADEVNAFLQLRSPYGSMTVLNDAGAGLRVSYVADTKLYIDQKMAAILSA